MENKGLYPLRFKPIFKPRIWGGNKLRQRLNKNIPKNISNCGESWEVSAVGDNISVIANGFLEGNNLEELVEIYMGDLVGNSVYEKFGIELPLLVKFIDASDNLSIQVHPNDELARERHHAYGKTEMWYVIDADPGAKIITGFNRDVTREEYLESLSTGKLTDLLNVETALAGNVYYIPAGRVHAIGRGVLLLEIQQTSDITYRIYDWDRLDETGKPRELHTSLALDAIDFSKVSNPKRNITESLNTPIELANCPYFTVNKLTLTQPLKRDYFMIDSFVLYICLAGDVMVNYPNGKEKIATGETMLIPAEIKNISLQPVSTCTIIEVFVG